MVKERTPAGHVPAHSCVKADHTGKSEVLCATDEREGSAHTETNGECSPVRASACPHVGQRSRDIGENKYLCPRGTSRLGSIGGKTIPVSSGQHNIFALSRSTCSWGNWRASVVVIAHVRISFIVTVRLRPCLHCSIWQEPTPSTLPVDLDQQDSRRAYRVSL